MAAPDLLEIVPNGDVTFALQRADETKVRIRVLSTTIIRASLYLEGMLKPDFAEGAAFANDGHVEVSLEDDDPETTVALFKAMHNQSLPDTVGLEELLDFAHLADKYLCHDCPLIKSCVEQWVRAWLSDENMDTVLPGLLPGFQGPIVANVTILRKLLEVAYVLHHGALFVEIGRKLLVQTTGDLTDHRALDGDLTVVLFRMELERNRHSEAMKTLVLRVLSNLCDLDGMARKHDLYICPGDECEWSDWVGCHSMRLFKRSGLWDYRTGRFAPQTIESLHATLKRVNLTSLHSSSRSWDCGPRCAARLPAIRLLLNNSHAVFQTEVDEIESFFARLCFACFTKGLAAPKEFQCEHQRTDDH